MRPSHRAELRVRDFDDSIRSTRKEVVLAVAKERGCAESKVTVKYLHRSPGGLKHSKNFFSLKLFFLNLKYICYICLLRSNPQKFYDFKRTGWEKTKSRGSYGRHTLCLTNTAREHMLRVELGIRLRLWVNVFKKRNDTYLEQCDCRSSFESRNLFLLPGQTLCALIKRWKEYDVLEIS